MYAKHGKLVEADASGTKASTKHIVSSLEVIQGHAFWDHWKANEGLHITALYITVGIESEISRQKGLSIYVFENPTVFRRPLSGESLRIFEF